MEMVTADPGPASGVPRDGIAPTVDVGTMRSVLGHFCTGVAVITGIDGGEPVGMTVQSLVSASLEPPLILVCPQRTSTSWPRIARGGVFCANILNSAQHALSLKFAKSGGPKFDGVPWRPGRTGAPILESALAHIECDVHSVHEAGDHFIVLGRVVDLAAGGTDGPLLFYRGAFGALAS
ncbi:monooxygenase [Acrocarpospora pleiomorpha]|uniref:Monooxygenase n=2 Tax=Acrocarpospora pleiomorpha TaxID=90975 RepID=A0A5M3XET4_9ACTN|nr:flavin reductase family protein [Acrocarpospora pleiomorpha]GES19136.1 monooxygenase [Acrocarpospora pleiomorpha]